MGKSIKMPRQGQSVESCIITKLYFDVGETVAKGDLLFAYETDKASFEEEAEEDGVILRWKYDEGDEVPVLETVCIIGDEGEQIDELIDNPVDDQVKISPRAKQMAIQKGVDQSTIKGTGPGGRIIVRDLENVTKQQPEVISSSGYRSEPLSNIRKHIADAMYASLQNSAQLTHHLGADARKMLKLREEIKSRKGQPGSINITINDMVNFAAIKALKKFDRVNAHLVNSEMRIFSNVNLGMAVDTDRGLLVPSIAGADNLSLSELSKRSAEIADNCRKGSVNPDILSPSVASFTVSNLGNYGVEIFTPVINLPQVAILGVNTIILRPSDTGDGVIGFLPYLGLSLTYDHRALDGGEASKFLKQVAIEIENLESLN